VSARPRGGRAVLLAAILATASALAAAAATSWGRGLLAEFATTSAPERAIGSPRLRAALVRERILTPQPPVDATAGVGRDCPDIELGPARLAAESAPSTLLAPADAGHRGRPYVALWIDPCRSMRLHLDPWNRGRESEEVGWVSIWNEGRLILSTAVGVRMHGGISRKDPPFSYRLYFRDDYGLAGVPAALLPDAPGEAISRLIVAELDDRAPDGRPWPFPGETAFAVGRRLGAEVPATRIAWFSINGDTTRPVSLIEHLGSDFLRRHYGHEGFDFVRGKREAGDPAEALFETELAWIAAQPAPLLATTAAARYDLDSLVTWFVTVVICGTGDLYQDAMVRDRSGEFRGGRWFWIHWDHDMSFRTPPKNSRFGRFRDASYAILWSARETDRAPSRALLLRLLAEDEAFRERVRERFVRAFASEVTPDFLKPAIDHLEGEVRAIGFTDLEFADHLRRFFADRPAEVLAQVDEVLAAIADPALARPPGLVRYRNRSASLNP
jgi:hypothetical protein